MIKQANLLWLLLRFNRQQRRVGKHTNTASWELLAVMFIGEALFGLPGLVAAPLYYGYAKKEWQAGGWI